jgi:hypothetical protein
LDKTVNNGEIASLVVCLVVLGLAIPVYIWAKRRYRRNKTTMVKDLHATFQAVASQSGLQLGTVSDELPWPYLKGTINRVWVFVGIHISSGFEGEGGDYCIRITLSPSGGGNWSAYKKRCFDFPIRKKRAVRDGWGESAIAALEVLRNLKCNVEWEDERSLVVDSSFSESDLSLVLRHAVDMASALSG